MLQESLRNIKDRGFEGRDLEIDSIGDLFESNQLSISQKKQIVEELIYVLQNEKDELVIESIFNLFVSAFGDNICPELVLNISVEMLDSLPPGSQEHAISIIEESDLQNKQAMLSSYL